MFASLWINYSKVIKATHVESSTFALIKTDHGNHKNQRVEIAFSSNYIGSILALRYQFPKPFVSTRYSSLAVLMQSNFAGRRIGHSGEW